MSSEPERTEREKELLELLNAFDADRRRSALRELKEMEEAGQISAPDPAPGWVNMHAHTFYSYNARGYSPARYAWEAHRRGLEAAGIVDFDCLDGTEEFLGSGLTLGLKAAAGFETRCFIPEYSDVEINSPNEPGVYYLAGTGFVEQPEPGTEAAETFEDMRRMARERNEAMMEKINAHVPEVAIDYDDDVLPLTPAGNATERHMLAAYESKAREKYPDTGSLAGFWAEKLNVEQDRVEAVIDDLPALKGLIRKKLMKKGGVGFVEPDESSFPDIDRVVEAALDCRALASACWLDGTSEGESDPMAHFRFLKDKGIPTMTIIPDRNWDIDDPDEKQMKLEKLEEVVGVARELHMPVLVGTEMNKTSQRFVDRFDAPELEPYVQDFRAGAHVAWGHTLLKMTAGLGYMDDWSREQFGDDEEARNDFYRRVGAAPMPDKEGMKRLRGMDADAAPEDVLDLLEG
jgi:hypothetical protein